MDSYKTLLDAEPPINYLASLLELALKAPVCRDNKEAPGTYRLAKVIHCAILRHMAEYFAPGTEDAERMVAALTDYLRNTDEKFN